MYKDVSSRELELFCYLLWSNSTRWAPYGDLWSSKVFLSLGVTEITECRRSGCSLPLPLRNGEIRNYALLTKDSFWLSVSAAGSKEVSVMVMFQGMLLNWQLLITFYPWYEKWWGPWFCMSPAWLQTRARRKIKRDGETALHTSLHLV